MDIATIAIRMHFDPLMSALGQKAAEWPLSRREAFRDEWNVLEADGAEMVDMQEIDGVFVASPSEDFFAHCAKYGVYPE